VLFYQRSGVRPVYIIGSVQVTNTHELSASKTSSTPRLEVSGLNVILREFSRDNLQDPSYLSWLRDMNNMELIDRIEYLKPINFEVVQSYVEGLWASETDAFFAIYERDKDLFIGTARLLAIDWRVRSAEIGIMIGHPDARGKGHAKDTISALCQYAFKTLSLQRLGAITADSNVPMKKCFLRLGFREEGRLRNHMLYHGELEDRLLFGLLTGELKPYTSST